MTARAEYAGGIASTGRHAAGPTGAGGGFCRSRRFSRFEGASDIRNARAAPRGPFARPTASAAGPPKTTSSCAEYDTPLHACPSGRFGLVLAFEDKAESRGGTIKNVLGRAFRVSGSRRATEVSTKTPLSYPEKRVSSTQRRIDQPGFWTLDPAFAGAGTAESVGVVIQACHRINFQNSHDVKC